MRPSKVCARANPSSQDRRRPRLDRSVSSILGIEVDMEISRRSLLVGVAVTGASVLARAAQNRVRVAAIQLHPKLADVSANLAQSEQMIREAIRQRAEWIV